MQEFTDLSRVFWHHSEADRRRAQKIRINEWYLVNSHTVYNECWSKQR